MTKKIMTSEKISHSEITVLWIYQQALWYITVLLPINLPILIFSPRNFVTYASYKEEKKTNDLFNFEFVVELLILYCTICSWSSKETGSKDVWETPASKQRNKTTWFNGFSKRCVSDKQMKFLKTLFFQTCMHLLYFHFRYRDIIYIYIFI